MGRDARRDRRAGAPGVARSGARGWALGIVLVAWASSVAGCLERREGSFSSGSPCTRCHGSDSRPGSDLLKSAPPTDLAGNIDPSVPAVGAHDIHLTASETHAPVACEACHVVPTAVDSPGHDDSVGPGKVIFGGIAAQGGRAPAYDRDQLTCADTHCHRDAAPRWTAPRDAASACGTCHGLPPPSPHVARDDCATCHGQVVDANRKILRPALHVDGIVQVAPDLACNTCHGDGDQGAPPPDLLGNLSTKEPGVGAHAIHLAGGAYFRKVACSECHAVPATVVAPGHLDTPRPAEVLFSGIAASKGATGQYDGATCTNVYCHGGFPRESGGLNKTPRWTVVDGSASMCGACHGLPPPLPHPESTLSRCRECHANVDEYGSILDGSLHVNGQVE